MISVEEVKNAIKGISQLTDGDLEGKTALIENAIGYTEKIAKGYSQEDKPRVIMLAAARSYYYLVLLNSNENGISSFRAGDVSFTKESSSLAQSAKEFYESTLSECSDLVSDGVVFRTA